MAYYVSSGTLNLTKPEPNHLEGHDVVAACEPSHLNMMINNHLNSH